MARQRRFAAANREEKRRLPKKPPRGLHEEGRRVIRARSGAGSMCPNVGRSIGACAARVARAAEYSAVWIREGRL